MDAAQYWIAIVHVVGFPPVLAAWVIVHTFIRFWRRVGPAMTYTAALTVIFAQMAVLIALRGPIMSVRFGAHTWLIALAIVFEAAAWWIGLLRLRQAGATVIIGLAELRATDEKPGKLITDGIYAHVRHPRYVEIGLHVIAVALFCNYLATWVLAAFFCPAVYAMVVLEEKELCDRFGEEYEEYCRGVPRFVPRLRRC